MLSVLKWRACLKTTDGFLGREGLMTSILTAAHEDFAFLMADRLISSAQGPIDDETNKITVVVLGPTIFLVAFTGIARMVGRCVVSGHDEWMDTQHWIHDRFLEEGPKCNFLPLETLETIGWRAGVDLERLPFGARDKKLSIIGIGFVRNYGDPRPVAWKLSNFERGYDPQDEASTEFSFLLNDNDASRGPDGRWSHIIGIDGSGSVVFSDANPGWRQYWTDVQQRAHPDRVAFDAYQLIKEAAAAKVGVGIQANAAYMLPTGDVFTRYFTSRPVEGIATPSIVIVTRNHVEHQSGGTIQMNPPAILAGPKLRKSAPCFCGSGVAYRLCHRSNDRWFHQTVGDPSAIDP